MTSKTVSPPMPSLLPVNVLIPASYFCLATGLEFTPNPQPCIRPGVDADSPPRNKSQP